MSALTPAQRVRLEAAIAAAEARTSAEFVCAVARASDRHLAGPLLVAALAALGLPFAVEGLDRGWSGVATSTAWMAIAQLAAFALLALALTRAPVANALTARSVLRRRAERLAASVFLDCGLASVRHRNGVLLFVSLAEHHVQVIADQGIFAAVDQAQWNAVVETFVARARSGALDEAFVATLDRLATLMAAAYPRRPDDVNEIPDHLLELD